MKIHLVTAEHFRDGGIIQKAFATEGAAAQAAADLVTLMLKDTRAADGPADFNTIAFTDTWRIEMERLQDYHGAAHCYVEVAEIEVAGGEGLVVKAYEPASPDEIMEASNIYADDDLAIDEDAAVSRADDGYWVSAWVWIANDDAEG